MGNASNNTTCSIQKKKRITETKRNTIKQTTLARTTRALKEKPSKTITVSVGSGKKSPNYLIAL